MEMIEKYLSAFWGSKENNIKIQKEKLSSFKGKLYKYYPLTSEECYFFKNLESDILYFSKPSTFNDPFDCYAGFSDTTLIQDITLILLFDPDFKLTNDQIEVFTKVILNEKITKNDIDILNSLVSKCSLKVNLNQLQSDNLRVRIINVFKLLNIADKKYYKEFFETCNNGNQLQKKLKEALNIVYGITCFCEEYDNALMWSHYANKHSGVCVEYDFSKIPIESELFLRLYPVIYTDKRECISLNYSYDENNHFKGEQFKMSLSEIIKTLITKSDVWSYEKEWRLIGFMKALNHQTCYLPIISKIFLGVNTKPEYANKIIEIARKKNIEVEKMELSSSKYLLESKKIDQHIFNAKD